MRALSSRLSIVLGLAVIALPSRAAAPVAAYCVSAGGSVAKDLHTGLVWQKSHVVLDWYGALDYCQSLKAGPFESGWRLPSIKELATIANGPQDPQGNSNAAEIFPDLNQQTEDVPFWSSTPVVGDPVGVWAIAFNNRVPYPSGFTMTPYSNIRFKVFEEDGTTLRKGYVRCVH